MTLRYLLDTNICIYIAKQHPKNVLRHFEQLSVGDVAISVISYGELIYGVEKSQHVQKNSQLIRQLINLIPPLALPHNAGDHYGKVRSQLEKEGKIIGNNDLWIAAHALAAELVLVTNNTKEFSRIPSLKIDNWVGSS